MRQMRKRSLGRTGHWTASMRARGKARFTGVLHEHEMGRKSECRNKGCTNHMLKGEIAWAAQVEGDHPHMRCSINERPDYSIGNYVLICKECGDRHQADPKYRLRRK